MEIPPQKKDPFDWKKQVASLILQNCQVAKQKKILEKTSPSCSEKKQQVFMGTWGTPPQGHPTQEIRP